MNASGPGYPALSSAGCDAVFVRLQNRGLQYPCAEGRADRDHRRAAAGLRRGRGESAPCAHQQTIGHTSWCRVVGQAFTHECTFEAVDCCVQSFQWMSRVLQAVDSIHQVGVYCLALVPPNYLPKVGRS